MIGNAVFVLSVALLAQSADQAASSDLAGRVQRLVRELDSAELSRRDAAEESLLRLGPQAIPLLPRDAPPGKAEVAQRLGRIRLKLQRAQAALEVQPSRVTLRGTMPVAKILASLQQQTGNKISAARLEGSSGVLGRELAVDFQQTVFWTALDRLLVQAGLAVYPFGDQGSVELLAPAGPRPSPDAGYVSYAGPFRFEVVSLLAQRDLRPPETGSLKIELEVAWEPRLLPISLKQRLADIEAVDERGHALAVETREATLEILVPRGPIARRVLVPMGLPPRDARRIAQLRGTLTALLPGQVETFRFQDLGRARDVTKRIAAAAVILEGTTRVGKSLEVRLLVHFDRAGDALASHRTWVFSNPVCLERGDGKTIPPDSVTPTRQTADEVGISVAFSVEGPSDGYTLAYQTPTMIFTAPLDYQFRDIPLP
jgi:hypothetical protein